MIDGFSHWNCNTRTLPKQGDSVIGRLIFDIHAEFVERIELRLRCFREVDFVPSGKVLIESDVIQLLHKQELPFFDIQLLHAGLDGGSLPLTACP